MSNPTTTENDAVVTALRQEKEKLQAELDELKKQHREAEAGAAVDAAVAAGKIRKEQAPHFKSLYLADASTTKALLDSMQPAAPASILAQTRPGSSATATVPAARADWTIRRWEQEDPEGLRRLMQENPEAYWAMYNAFYPKR